MVTNTKYYGYKISLCKTALKPAFSGSVYIRKIMLTLHMGDMSAAQKDIPNIA